MSTDQSRILRYAWRLINLAAVLALCVVILGAWTRINNAGLSCPDWPGCYGHMVLPSDPEKLQQVQQLYPEQIIEQGKTQLEMAHRYLAGGLGMVIMLLAACALLMRNKQSYPVWQSYGMFLLVIIQALFGMWTVTLKLYPPVVTLHLLGGVVTLMIILLVRFRIRLLLEQNDQGTQSRKNARLLKLALGVLLIQIVLGGWTSSNYAGTACSDWLQCNSQADLQPDFATGFNPVKVIGPNYEGGLLPIDARAAIHIGHRIGAAIVTLTVICLTVKLYRYRHLRGPLLVLGFLLVAQLVLGGMNVTYAVPAGLAIVHHSMAVALLMVLLWIHGRLKVQDEV
ncbi:heme A synthase [uncultured Neptuniibacter sp.]|uniref:COX15/CtaA family protein n=1 Tax=uncultured Neptuniibacter sp. TaxID=502143 RepID=UPI00261ADE84|nr:COX15/CtaA family protein [uncultured Neptuniibacter sp.]